MKRIVIGGILVILSLSVIGQKSAVDKVFDKYNGKEGYTTVYISSFMFNMLNSLETDDPEYNEFKKATAGINSIKILTQEGGDSEAFGAELLELLPFGRRADEEGPAVEWEDYIFSPSAAEIIAELIPEAVRARLWECFTEAAVSEHLARMRAMKAATDNAEHMNRVLMQQYNRARQSQITLDLMDIIGGAEALQ